MSGAGGARTHDLTDLESTDSLCRTVLSDHALSLVIMLICDLVCHRCCTVLGGIRGDKRGRFRVVITLCSGLVPVAGCSWCI